MKKDTIFTWKIAGTAGQGQQIAGLILSKVLAKHNQYCFAYSEYSSRLRGGLATSQVSISNQRIGGVYKTINLLFALSQNGLDSNLNCLDNRAVVFYDNKKVQPSKQDKIKYIPLNLEEDFNKNQLNRAYYNIYVLGITLALFNYPLNELNLHIIKTLEKKGSEIIQENKKAAKLGWEFGSNYPKILKANKKKNNNNLVITANEAISLGAVASDCKLYSAYPMTPASSILHILAKWSKKAQITVIHSEDEIAAINLAIGASWGGVRAMTGTSGGGFALMNEALSLSGTSEIPLVIVDAQRPGPSTGMATWTEQGDLAYLSKTGNGEFPRIILAPSSAQDAFDLTVLAFNLADKYQTPVFLLVDKYIASSYQTIENFDFKKVSIDRGKLITQKELDKIGEFKRYDLSKDGVSPRSIPGQKNGYYLANGNEHTLDGLTIDGFSREMRIAQMDKRMSKLNGIMRDLPKPILYGSKQAKTILIGWGSVKGPVLEALKGSSNVGYLHLTTPYPLDKKVLEKMTKRKKIAVIENNYSGQLANLLQETLGCEIKNRFNKYDGQQFWPEEIEELIKEL